MKKILKVFLSVLFFLCLMDMPYGFYQLVRFIAVVGFALLAYLSNNRGNNIAMFIYIVLAILFQPFIKLALGREIWNMVDVIVGVGLILSIFFQKKIN